MGRRDGIREGIRNGIGKREGREGYRMDERNSIPPLGAEPTRRQCRSEFCGDLSGANKRWQCRRIGKDIT